MTEAAEQITSGKAGTIKTVQTKNRDRAHKEAAAVYIPAAASGFQTGFFAFARRMYRTSPEIPCMFGISSGIRLLHGGVSSTFSADIF